MPYSKIFKKGKCNFFDDLVSYLSTLTSLGIALHGYNHWYTRAYRKDEVVALYGIKDFIDLELRFSPHQMMKKLASNSWPRELLFVASPRPKNTSFDPDHKAPNETIRSNVKGVLGFQMQGGFIRFFESHKHLIKEKHGYKPWNWPQVWLFAWMVLNAFAHDGQIDIRKKNSPKIS